jgi:Flp pilus assembly protein protease CpaA
MSAVSSYFIGFALVGGGFIIFMLALLLMTRRDKTIYQKRKATISRLHREEAERRRRAA